MTAPREDDGTELVEVIRASSPREAAEIAEALRAAGVDAVPDIALGGEPCIRVLVAAHDVAVAEAILDATVLRPEGDATLEDIERAFEEHATERERRERAAAAPAIMREESRWSLARILVLLFLCAVIGRVGWALLAGGW